MALYWDMQEVSIVNNTGMPLGLSTAAPLPHGEWDAYPASYIANTPGTTATLAFRTRSVNAAEVGPGPGTVVYLFTDGTPLTITFDMIFADWQNSQVAAIVGGTSGSSYAVTITCYEDHFNGQGRRFYSTITLAPSNVPGKNSAQCVVQN